MAYLQMVEGGVNGYTAVQVISTEDYERIEVYGVYRYPARLLEESDDPTIFVDTSRPYQETDTDLLYRAYGMNECELYQIGEINADQSPGYKEDEIDGKRWGWFPASYNLIKNADTFDGTSFRFFKPVEVVTPNWIDVADKHANLLDIRNRVLQSTSFNYFKMARLPAPSDGSPVMSFVVRPKDAYRDIFVPFGANEYLIHYSKLVFNYRVNIEMDIETPPLGWARQWDYSTNPASVVGEASAMFVPPYSDFQIDVYVDGVLTQTQLVQPNVGSAAQRQEAFIKNGSKATSLMELRTVEVPITGMTEEVEFRFSRPAGLKGNNVHFRFRTPLVYFDDPPYQTVGTRALTTHLQDNYLDRSKAPNNIAYPAYPYISEGIALPLAAISEEPHNASSRTVNGVEMWEALSNVHAEINGYDLVVLRNYELQSYQRNPFRQWIWSVQPIREYPRDGRLVNPATGAGIPRKIDPMWTPDYVLPGSSVRELNITPPVGTTISTDTIPGWEEIPQGFAKVYNPDGLIDSSEIKLEGIQKEIFGDVSRIDFTEYKELVYPMSAKALGRCNLVVPGYGELSDADLYLLDGSFAEAMSSDSKVHTSLNGWRQVYSRKPKWDETSIRLGVVGRARAVMVLKALISNPYFGIALDDEAQQYFDTFEDSTFAISGRINFQEWGKDTTRGPVVIIDFDVKRIVRPLWVVAQEVGA